MDTTSLLFWTCLAVTLAALGAALVTGLRRRRRHHLRLAPISMALLGLTVWMAERMARARDFPEQEMATHLVFAKSAAGAALLVIATGVLLWRTGRGRRVHLACVVLFLVLAVVATGTGVWVFGLSTPR